MPIDENTVTVTNVSPADCIPLNFTVSVYYTNANGVNGTVSLGCGGANGPPDLPAPGPTGTLAFALAHGGVGQGHTLTVDLNHDGVKVAGDGVTNVGIGDPCPIEIGGIGGGTLEGLPILDPNLPLGGTFKPAVGNRVVILVLEPKYDEGMLRQPLLTFAGPASVAVEAGPPQGMWKHDVIPGAKNGQHVRIVLTKDGVVKAAVRAIFHK